MPYDFGSQIISYAGKLDSLHTLLPGLMYALNTAKTTFSNERDDFLEKNAVAHKKVGEDTEYKISIDKVYQFRRIDRKYDTIRHGYDLLPETFLISLVAQFDAYIGHLIRGIYTSKPEVLNACNSDVPLSILLNFKCIDEAKDYAIEKQSETILRQSHADQFDALGNLLGCSLRNGLESWPSFIEITERRNLFVHCNGIVSRQYLSVCRKHSATLEQNIDIGHKLSCPGPYFNNAYACLFEIGVKLGQVIWRQLCKDELAKADVVLNNLSFDKIITAQYPIAIKLLEFGVAPSTKHASTEMLSTFKINLAQAYKWNSNFEKCKETLASTDWSDREDRFKLCVAVLLDQFTDASKIMHRIGPTGSVSRTDYIEWPIFRDFRKSPDCQKTYAEIFGEPLRMTEEVVAKSNESKASSPKETISTGT